MKDLDLTSMGTEQLMLFIDEYLNKDIVHVDKQTGCWTWLGPKRNKEPFLKETQEKAVKATFGIYKGKTIKKYTRIECKCGNPDCVNPDHIHLIEPKPRKSNIPKGSQAKKRIVQTKQNKRIIEYIEKSPELSGNMIILSGPKVEEATSPYLNTSITDKILICEKEKKNYQDIALALNKLDRKDILLYHDTADIMDVAAQIDRLKGNWTGFDFDFSGIITPVMMEKFKIFISKMIIKQPVWWMRITVTARQKGYKGNNEDFDKLLAYIFSSGSIMIEDLARGPVYNYCDSSAMQTMQIICKRR